ncbi:MAG: DciA family protein [Pseudomonadales bacterium]
MSTRKIEDLLGEGHNRFSPLQRLLGKANNQKQWTAEIRALIDHPIRHEVEVTDIRGNIAYILCSNAATATRLRFLLPEMRPALANLQSFSRVNDFKIRVSGT